MEVGDKLNPQRSCRKGFAVKGIRQHIIKTNNPSTIGPDELLTVQFPDLKENQVIIPSTTKLTFNILTRVSLYISIAHQKVLRVYYSFLLKKGVPLNLVMILKNSLILR